MSPELGTLGTKETAVLEEIYEEFRMEEGVIRKWFQFTPIVRLVVLDLLDLKWCRQQWRKARPQSP